MPIQQYDIVIVGAGLTGSSLAGALAAVTDKRIAVLERSLPQAITSPNSESRPISLSYGSQQALASMGWWDRLSAQAAPIRSVCVSQVGRLGIVDFKAGQFGLPALGYAIPYDYLHQALYEATAGHPQVDFIQIQGIESIDSQSGSTHLSLQKQGVRETIQTKLLVAADGANSDCCQLLNISSQAKDSGSVALSGELQLASAHKGKALQRFSKEGIIAILPLADPHRVRFVLSLTAEQKEATQLWGKKRWLAFWKESLRGHLMVEACKKSAEFPLQTQLAAEVVRPGVVILGNAAHTIYPLAAQGFNLTLRDVAALVELLVDAMNDGPVDWAGQETLSAYAQWREKDARQLKCFTEFLQGAFNVQIPGFDHVRGLGLMALDMLPGGKQRMGRWLLGLGGKVPKLMRGVLPTQYSQPEVEHA